MCLTPFFRASVSVQKPSCKVIKEPEGTKITNLSMTLFVENITGKQVN